MASTGRRGAWPPLVLVLAALLAPALGQAQTCTWGGTPSLPMPTVAALRSDARLLSAPARLAIDGEGRRYVTDPVGGRLLVRDANGRLVRALDGLGRPLGVAVDAFGVAYVGDELTGSVALFDPTGTSCGSSEGATASSCCPATWPWTPEAAASTWRTAAPTR